MQTSHDVFSRNLGILMFNHQHRDTCQSVVVFSDTFRPLEVSPQETTGPMDSPCMTMSWRYFGDELHPANLHRLAVFCIRAMLPPIDHASTGQLSPLLQGQTPPRWATKKGVKSSERCAATTTTTTTATTRTTTTHPTQPTNQPTTITGTTVT